MTKILPKFKAHFNQIEKLVVHPMGEDIGKAAAYLCSSDSDYVTGTILPVDGGYRLKHCRDVPAETV